MVNEVTGVERVKAEVAKGWAIVRWHQVQMWRQFFDHDCLSAAGALTYTMLFAVVPLMTVTFTIFSLIPQYASVGEQVQDFVFENFVPGSSDMVQEKLIEFSDRARNLTVAGFVFLFVTAFLMLVTIEKSFNTIWHVAEPRRGLQRFLLYWGVLSLGPAFAIIGMLSSIYLFSLPLVTDLDGIGLGDLILGYLPVILSVALFTVLYYAVPNCHVPFMHALSGGLITMLVFQVAFAAFSTVSKWFSYNAVYGTFAAVPVFLIWLYLVWVIILCGAIFVRTLSLVRDDDLVAEPLLIKAARVLRLLHEAHMQGASVTDKEINRAVKLNRREHDRVFRVFQDLKLLNQTEDEQWILGRNLKGVTLWELYQLLPEGLDLDKLKSVTDMQGVVQPLISITQFGSNEMSVTMDMVFSS